MDDVIKLNIAFKLPESISDWAISVNQQIAAKFPLEYVLSKTENLPHVTLYYTAFPTKNLEKIKQKLTTITKVLAPQDFELEQITHNQTYLMAEYKLTTLLRDLHMLALAELNPLRENYLREKYRPESENFKSLNSEQQRIASQYGHPYVEDLYHPHLSLGMTVDASQSQSALELIRQMPTAEQRFASSGLVLYAMGEDGTCKEVIAEFPFQI